MENSGWISLHRKILENAVSFRPAWFSVWVHLLLLANHKETEIIWNGQKVVLKPGQFITGRYELAKKCGVSPSLVERVLKYLEIEHQIGQQKFTKYRIITILNWEKYQSSDTKSDNKRTTSGQQADTDNNYNNNNNDNKREIEEANASPTPKQKAKMFFKGITDFLLKNGSVESLAMSEFLKKISTEQGIESLQKKKSFWDEIVKFGDYWQEKDQLGKKERWEMQKTFEVDKRLRTWLKRSGHWQNQNNTNKLGLSNNKYSVGIVQGKI